MQSFIDAHISDLVQKRRTLHQLAEISGKERRTASQIYEWLEQTGPDALHSGLGGNGIIAIYDPKNGNASRSLMFRAELDGLPIPDPDDWEHASENQDAGHKCGHDGHMTHLLGLAAYLGENRPEHIRVMLLFQPAEETGEGAQWILDDPRFDATLRPDVMIALHNLPGFAKHSIIVKEGAFSSASVGMIFRLNGATSHAAHPEDGNSPALAMAAVINALTAMGANSFAEPTQALVTIVHAKLRLGEIAFGTTPGKAEIMATLRASETDVLERMIPLAEKQVRGIASGWDLGVEVGQTEYFKTTFNDAELSRELQETCRELGLETIIPSFAFPWSEDFGRFSDISRVLLFGLGAGREHPQLHNRGYDYPDELLVTGLRVFLAMLTKEDQPGK